MDSKLLCKLAEAALEEIKAIDIKVLDVQGLTSVTDLIVIATGTSSRHVKAISDNRLEQAAKEGIKPLGVEGESEAEWILVDLGDIVVHIMQAETRDFYNLEKLWDRELLEASTARHS